MDMKNMINKIHFINVENDEMVAVKITEAVPRVGDEIRLREDLFYEVIKVVWVYDEEEPVYQRVNIGVKPIAL